MTEAAANRALYRRLLGYVRPYLGQLVLASLAMIVVAATSSAVPVLVEPVMDDIFVARNMAMLWPLAAGIVGLFTAKAVCTYIQGYLMGRVGHRIIADLRGELMAHLMGQDLRFFHARPTGEMVSRLTFDTTQIQQAVTRALTGVFQHSLTIAGLIGVVFYQNWRLALIAVVVFPIAVYPLLRFGRSIRRFSGQGQEQMAVLNSLLYEAFGGIRVVKVFRIEGVLGARIREEIDRLYHTFRRTVRVQQASSPLMEWIGAIGVAAVILVGGRQVISGQLSTGQFFSFLAAVMLLYDPVRRMNGTWQEIQQGLAAGERIFDWLDARPTIQSPPDGRTLDGVRQGVRFEGVGFRYHPGGPAVLADVELEIPVGKVVALAGPSGGGKSTLADLLPRFHDPTAGRITIDGIDLRALTVGSLRDQLAMVDQHTVLFDDTVRNNIRFGRPDADDAAVEAAARDAFAAEFIAGLPDGYDTMIGENGVSLSGGQRQRLAIARALLKNAPILILDEATSALDTESEREVQAALERLLKGRTALVIAHRLSTIRRADEICVLEAGRIVERGTHAELRDAGGLYAKLHAMQNEGGPA